MGGAGSKSLVETLRLFDKKREHEIIGTHCFPLELVKSDLEHCYLVPRAYEGEAYFNAHKKIIDQLKIDLFIANSDNEVAAISPYLDQLSCAHLIPGRALVGMVQDKFLLNTILKKHGCKTVPNVHVQGRDKLAEAVAQLPKTEKFWIRVRGGSGSAAATWVKTAEQAQKWMDLWCELRGVDPTSFVVAPFLPGSDYCVAVLFQDGDFCIGKAYERLGYIVGGITLSGMGSTPSNARTVPDKLPVDAAIAAVRAACGEFGIKPHGYFQLDLKCDEAGTPYVTEINIGRFPMTNPHFDRVGKYILFEQYIQLALEPEKKLPRGVYDLVDGMYILRSIDFPIVFASQEEVARLSSLGV